MVKKGTIATIIAVPIVALGGAGGYYAWQQHNDSQQQQERRLSKAEHALSSLRSESEKQATSDKKTASSISQSSVDATTSNDTSVAEAGAESASAAASTATASQYDIFSDPNASIEQVTQAAREVVNQYTQTDLSSWALSGIRYVDGGYHVQATDPNSTTSVRYQFHMTPHEATVTMDSSSNPGMAAGTINY
ncbi:hypothetical protein B9D04_09295 [Weissella cibaria]|jgi:predicted lipid-binding transport protein (Tim44 family)|uniref:Uncharacterized protein n=1 Tax=Weissella cibaria TaxID=137591 RepID=A0A1X4JJ31_9LACO|nr:MULTISPECIES: hypothetical protein [Weissella]APS26181.1 hypothetical protein AUC63_00093 [Weissella cibaria]APU63684.1 hypothetical protein AUC65_01921 [Weissella cibaria]APU65834.1 hypothetical protein AUC62_01913 [Weissella cibaria]ASS52890.1 hypothetical protein CHR48_02000 [Weissella cibaria]KXU07215.1 hypothetical protein WEIDD23_00959 [Weissella sp. DD23]